MASPPRGSMACTPATVEQLHIDPDGAPITLPAVISTIMESKVVALTGRTMIVAMGRNDPYPHPRPYHFS
jgi:hypothetical protein